MSSSTDLPADKKTTRQRILEAASRSFRALGYARTTTQAIAAQADVAEVTIFRHFGSKEKLFQAVVQQIGGARGLDGIESRLTGDVYQDMLFVSRHVLSFFLAQRETISMLMFESTHFPEVRRALAQNPREIIQMLSRYFQEQIERGKMKNVACGGVTPEVMAQAFISMLFGYVIAMHPLAEFLSLQTSLDEAAEHFVHIFLKGTATLREEDH